MLRLDDIDSDMPSLHLTWRLSVQVSDDLRVGLRYFQDMIGIMRCQLMRYLIGGRKEDECQLEKRLVADALPLYRDVTGARDRFDRLSGASATESMQFAKEVSPIAAAYLLYHGHCNAMNCHVLGFEIPEIDHAFPPDRS